MRFAGVFRCRAVCRNRQHAGSRFLVGDRNRKHSADSTSPSVYLELGRFQLALDLPKRRLKIDHAHISAA